MNEMEKTHQKLGKSKQRHSDEKSTSFPQKKQRVIQGSPSASFKSLSKKRSGQDSGNARNASGIIKKKHMAPRASSSEDKKPFDKKKWRMQKYDNKFKLQQWEEKRKKAITRRYERDMKNYTGPKLDVNKIYEQAALEDQDSEDDSPAENLKINKKKKNDKRATFEERQEQYNKMKAEKEAALKKYKEEKAKNAKRLSQRTKKGQPVMKGRMEMLLERIQKSLH